MSAIKPYDATAVHDVQSSRIAGWILIVVSLLSVMVMLHHPTAGKASSIHVHGEADLIDRFARMAGVNRLVHGTLIVLVCVLMLGLSYLSCLLGGRTLLFRAGLIAYGLGTGAGIASGLINGFITPGFIDRLAIHQDHSAPATGDQAFVDESSSELATRFEMTTRILTMAWSANQECSRLAVLALSAAWFLWSVSMLKSSGITRRVGVLGTLVGSGLTIGAVSGRVQMNVPGMLTLVICQAVWTCSVGWLLVTQPLNDPSHEVNV